MGEYGPRAKELYFENGRVFIDEEKFIIRLFGEDYQDSFQQLVNELDPSRNIPSLNGVGYFARLFFNRESINVTLMDFNWEVKMYDTSEEASAATEEMAAQFSFSSSVLPTLDRELDINHAPGFLYDSFAYRIPAITDLFGTMEDFNISSARLYDALDEKVLRAYFSYSISTAIQYFYLDLARLYYNIAQNYPRNSAEATEKEQLYKSLRDTTPDLHSIIELELRRLISELGKQKDIGCVVCSTPSANVCSKCDKVRYCSTDCQRQDWSAHKDHCH